MKQRAHTNPGKTKAARFRMRSHGYDQLDDFRGALNLRACRDAAAFERANYIRALQSWKV